MLAFSLAKGYGLLWIVIYVTAALVNLIQRFFRVNMYDHSNAYVISNLLISCCLQAGWSAFAAITVHSFVPGAPIWIVVILYLIGVLSCLTAFFAVSSFYQGETYKLVSLPLALVIFIIFSLWPARVTVCDHPTVSPAPWIGARIVRSPVHNGLNSRITATDPDVSANTSLQDLLPFLNSSPIASCKWLAVDQIKL